MENDSIFHVHTFRCKHAGDEEDKLYVEKAIELGASEIVFTDHSPFPGNLFGNRMDIEQLPEYIDTIKVLKQMYVSDIDVKVGLEIEYLPKFQEYYKELYLSGQLDVMMLGQHFYENADGSYSFLNSDKRREFVGLGEALVQGMQTGYFSVVAHPDRCFRRCKEWTEEMETVSNHIISVAQKHGVILERNYSSMKRKKQYWNQFWERAAEIMQVEGYDAHSVAEMEETWKQIHQK